MTADTTAWHEATVARTGEDRAFAYEFLAHQLSKLVDQETWDAAVTLTLGVDALAQRLIEAAESTALVELVVPQQGVHR